MATARTLYLFQYGDTEHYAASRDKTGCNLPKDGRAWLLRGTIRVEQLEEELPSAIAEIDASGFCIMQLSEPEPE